MNKIALIIALAALNFIKRDEKFGSDYYVYMHDIREAYDVLHKVRWLYFR